VFIQEFGSWKNIDLYDAPATVAIQLLEGDYTFDMFVDSSNANQPLYLGVCAHLGITASIHVL
jgi:hypothetical protein